MATTIESNRDFFAEKAYLRSINTVMVDDPTMGHDIRRLSFAVPVGSVWQVGKIYIKHVMRKYREEVTADVDHIYRLVVKKPGTDELLFRDVSLGELTFLRHAFVKLSPLEILAAQAD